MKKEIIIRDINSKNEGLKIKEIDEKFHGQIIIHFAHGVPKKTECNLVEDVKTLINILQKSTVFEDVS